MGGPAGHNEIGPIFASLSMPLKAKGERVMYGNENDYAKAEADTDILMVDVADDELERVAALNNNGPEFTLAYCTWESVCPF